MTPEQAIKHTILLKAVDLGDLAGDDKELVAKIAIEETIDELFETFENALYDAKNEVRAGGEETGLPSKNYSRHYEVNEVAIQTPYGWVGWSYWFGGGKHGEPEAIDWINEAYFLDCKEEEKMMVVRTFTRTIQ